jgi:hypothetical protein
MSTRNFYSANPTGIYALESDDDSDALEYAIEDAKSNIIEMLKEKGVDVREQDCASSDNDRNYGGWLFAMAYGQDNGNYEYVTVELLTRSGYYSGVNFDYIIGYLVEGEEYDDESLEDAHVFDNRKQDYVAISKTRVKHLRQQANALRDKIAFAYASNTDKLRVVGQFSNGEAVYEKV